MADSKLPYRLLTPGPVPLAPEVLEALARPVMHHRTPEFEAILKDVWADLKWLFQTAQPVMLLTSTGSGAMEAALVNVLSPGDEVLCLVGGKFGERWADMVNRFQAQAIVHAVPWGEPVDPNTVKQLLEKHPHVKAVLLQAVETSTATQNPVREIAKIVHEHSNALVMVDAITGLGAMPLAMDDWGLDVVVAGSQKALMLPTGLSFIALSERAWTRAKTATTPRYYFDLQFEVKANQKGQTYFSSANSHIVALQVALKRFKKLGLNQIIRRCEDLAEATRQAGEALGLKTFSKAPAASVTALLTPPQMNGAQLRDHLEQKYNVTVMGGQDQLQGKVLRIGHLGYITNKDLLSGIELLGQSLLDLKAPIEPKDVVAALSKAGRVLASSKDVDESANH